MGHELLALRAGPHPERARRDAEELLLHLLRKNARERSRAWLFANPLSPISAPIEDEFLCSWSHGAWPASQSNTLPASRNSIGLPCFALRQTVLIPRPETELLVERVMQLLPKFLPQSDRSFEFRKIHPHTWLGSAPSVGTEGTEPGENNPSRRPRMLDIGTGSGAIAISIAGTASGRRGGDHGDRSGRGWPSNLHAKTPRGQWGLRIAFDSFKATCSTPLLEVSSSISSSRTHLYVPDTGPTAAPSLSVEVREHEPALALFAGADGLDIYRRLIPRRAYAALVSGGSLLLEIGYGQSATIEGTSLTAAGFESIEVHPDLQGIPRVVCGLRARPNNAEPGLDRTRTGCESQVHLKGLGF